MRRNDTCKHGAMLTEPCDDCVAVPMTTPPPDTKVQSETQIADDLPYRIVEGMGLGLTFRSCTCGQLPCARLRPIRDALEVVRQDERERCAKLAELMATGETYGTGRQKAINIAAAIRGNKDAE